MRRAIAEPNARRIRRRFNGATVPSVINSCSTRIKPVKLNTKEKKTVFLSILVQIVRTYISGK